MENKTLKDYHHEAKRVIGKWGRWEWQLDEECVAFVSYWMMRADWKYDPTKGVKRSTYRVCSGRWAVVSWANKLKKRDEKAKKILSINFDIMDEDGHSIEFGDIIASESKAEDLINSELVNSYLNHKCLSDKLRQYLQKYFLDGYNCQEIATQMGVSRQAVSEGLRRGIVKLKVANGVSVEKISKKGLDIS